MISADKLVLKDHAVNKMFSNPYTNHGTFFIYDTGTQSFRIIPEVPQVRGQYYTAQTCRETTETVWKATEYVPQIGFFLSSGLDPSLVNEMFVKLKKALALPVDEKVIIHEVDCSAIPLAGTFTNPVRAVILDLPPFWVANGLRRGMFTLFLRCAAVFYKGDLEKAFAEYVLLKSCRAAVDLFLAGNTFPAQVDYTTNMVYSLKDKTVDQLKGLMKTEYTVIPPPPIIAAAPQPAGINMVNAGPARWIHLGPAPAPLPEPLRDLLGAPVHMDRARIFQETVAIVAAGTP